jgi:hypothetical protein
MNLSKLTNPEDTDFEKPSVSSVPVSTLRQIPLQSMLNSEPTPTQAEQPSKDSTASESISIINEPETEPSNNEVKQTGHRSTSEYRTLYNYLLEKYKSANQTSKVLDEFELYLKNLSKYQQLRNNMLVDTLKYLNKYESLTPMDPTSHTEITQKLKSIQQKDPSMKEFLFKFIELENLEDPNDSRLNINTFHDIIGINDSLSSDLAIQEQNTYPDLYPGKFDSFELVKKNQLYEHKIKTLDDLKEQIQYDCQYPPILTDSQQHIGKKRKGSGSAINSIHKSTDVKPKLSEGVEKNSNKKIKLENKQVSRS